MCKIRTLTAAVLAGLVLSSCGGATQGVLRIGNTSISKASYNHWLAAMIGLTSSATPNGPRLVFDPPEFVACIARLRIITPLQNSARLSAGRLKATCQKEYAAMRERTVSYLIYAYSLRGEATDRHVSVSDGEVQARFNRVRRQQYPTKASFQKALASSGETVADLLFEVRTQLLAAKLQRQIVGATKPGAAQSAERTFAQELQRRWTSRTSCQPGYVVKGCKQYR